ncbi:kinase-like domain-containing protein [Xylaria scruposa]|nr:kinase-like domain-containing protein [Xylaria scruposa]
METSQKEDDQQREASRTNMEGSSKDQTSPKSLNFATFEPGSISAVHLLETVKVAASPNHYLSQCLISNDENLLYLLSIRPVTGDEAAPALTHVATWRIGAGPTPQLREKGVPCCEVDLLICPPGRSAGSTLARQSIGSVHAILQIHAASGSLLLRNIYKKPIIYLRGHPDGRHLTLHGGNSCLLFHQYNHLRFGDYEFVLGFSLDSLEDRDNFRTQRNQLLLNSYGQWPSQHLDVVPSPSHMTNSDVRIHRTLSQETGRCTYSGIRLHTGEPVLLRRIYCSTGTQHQVQNELQVTAMFDASASFGVLGMLGQAWCQHGVSPPCQIESETPAEDVYYATRLVEYDFLSLPLPELRTESDILLDYFHQTLKGLAKLHGKGLIHGRLSPASLVLVPTQENPQEGNLDGKLHDLTLPPHPPMTAAISDLHLAKASVYRDDKPDSGGHLVAPEVYTSSAATPYTEQADIWGLAMSWLLVFVKGIRTNVKITRGTHEKIQRTIHGICKRGQITKPFCNLLLSMVEWDPDDRPIIKDILANKVWRNLQKRKSKRVDKAQQDIGPDAKKVRVLSPGAEE